MTTISSISVLPFERVEADSNLLRFVQDSLDTPLNDSRDADTVHQYFGHKDLGLVIFVEGRPAGLFGLGQNTKRVAGWLTSTLIFNEFRGSGLNQLIKGTVAQTALRIDLPLGCLIRDWNIRSIRATQKAFPELEPIPIELDYRNEPESSSGWYFDFSKVNYTPMLEDGIELSFALTAWWHNQQANVKESIKLELA